MSPRNSCHTGKDAAATYHATYTAAATPATAKESTTGRRRCVPSACHTGTPPVCPRNRYRQPAAHVADAARVLSLASATQGPTHATGKGGGQRQWRTLPTDIRRSDKVTSQEGACRLTDKGAPTLGTPGFTPTTRRNHSDASPQRVICAFGSVSSVDHRTLER